MCVFCVGVCVCVSGSELPRKNPEPWEVSRRSSVPPPPFIPELAGCFIPCLQDDPRNRRARYRPGVVGARAAPSSHGEKERKKKNQERNPPDRGCDCVESSGRHWTHPVPSYRSQLVMIVPNRYSQRGRSWARATGPWLQTKARVCSVAPGSLHGRSRDGRGPTKRGEHSPNNRCPSPPSSPNKS